MFSSAAWLQPLCSFIRNGKTELDWEAMKKVQDFDNSGES